MDYLLAQTGKAIPDMKLEKSKEKNDDDSDEEDEEEEQEVQQLVEDDITFPDSLGRHLILIVRRDFGCPYIWI